MKENRPIKKPFDPKLEAVGGFLCLDVLALVCFGFAGFTGLLVLRIVGAFLALLLFPYFRYHLSISKKEPLPIIAMVSFFFLGISYYWITYYTGAIAYGILLNLVTVIGYIAFFVLGASIRRIPRIKKEYVALAVLGGLALLVIITGFYSLIRYGFFYAKRFEGMVYYYDGVVFQIAKEGKVLDGFLFREASMAFAKVPSFLLACSGVGLFALKPSKDNWRFWTLLAFALIGLLDLVLTPFTMGLLLLIPVYVLVGIHRLLLFLFPGEEGKGKRSKIGKVIFIVLLLLTVITVLTLTIDAFLGEEKSFLRKIPLLFHDGNPNRLGSYVVKIEDAIGATLFSTKGGVRSLNLLSTLFGTSAVVSSGNSLSLVVYDTNIFEFSVLYQNGFVGFIGLMFLIFFGIYETWRYIEYDEEDCLCRKLAYAGILLGGFVYLSLLNDELPLIHAYQLDEIFSYHSSVAVYVTRSSYFLLFAFLLGYVYTPKPLEEKKEDEAREETTKDFLEEIKEANVNE